MEAFLDLDYLRVIGLVGVLVSNPEDFFLWGISDDIKPFLHVANDDLVGFDHEEVIIRADEREEEVILLNLSDDVEIVEHELRRFPRLLWIIFARGHRDDLFRLVVSRNRLIRGTPIQK